MTALLLKDLRVLRPWWWLIVPAHMLFGVNGIVAPQVFFAMNVVLALALSMALFIIEWQQDSDRFVGSLPVSRSQVVRARYAWALGVALLGTALYAVYGSLLLAVGTERLLARWPGTPGWGSVEGLATFFATVWLVSVAYLPFYFRAGLAKGTWWFVASATPLIAVVAAVQVLWRSGPGLSPGASVVLGETGSAVALLAFAAAMGWLSLRLSVRSYERRDL